jgi:citrate lyase beta subunit
MAILNARTIAATAVHAESRLCCLVMGTNDLIKESGARALHDRFAVVLARHDARRGARLLPRHHRRGL